MEEKKRRELHELLCGVLGSRNVYFQPPENTRMRYPAIRYQRYRLDADHADNLPYRMAGAYQVTVIDADPDSGIVERVARLPMCRFDRHYASDNLNHDVFIIYH